MRIMTVVAFLGISAVLVSCSDKKSEEAQQPAPLPKTFSYTDTDAVVKAEEIQTADVEKRSLKADFNLDGLSDLAVIRSEGNSHNEVDIYIQKKPDAETEKDSPIDASFFRGGTIKRPDDGKIIGLASRQEKKMVDIILLVAYTNQPNQMIHYRNDGKSFTEVDF